MVEKPHERLEHVGTREFIRWFLPSAKEHPADPCAREHELAGADSVRTYSDLKMKISKFLGA